MLTFSLHMDVKVEKRLRVWSVVICVQLVVLLSLSFLMHYMLCWCKVFHQIKWAGNLPPIFPTQIWISFSRHGFEVVESWHLSWWLSCSLFLLFFFEYDVGPSVNHKVDRCGGWKCDIWKDIFLSRNLIWLVIAYTTCIFFLETLFSFSPLHISRAFSYLFVCIGCLFWVCHVMEWVLGCI